MNGKVLITGCAGEIAISIADILRENFSTFEVFGCDIQPRGTLNHNYVETFLQMAFPRMGNTQLVSPMILAMLQYSVHLLYLHLWNFC